MARRRKLRVVPDLPVSPAEPKPPERQRLLSHLSRTMFRPGQDKLHRYLTIGQLVRAFQGDKRVHTYGLNLTPTDLDVLRFVFNSGAPDGGLHRWRVYGDNRTLAQSIKRFLKIATSHIHVSLARLDSLGLVTVSEREVRTTEWMHEMGAEMLWCDLLSNACPEDVDQGKFDWFKLSSEVDWHFGRKPLLDPKKAGDRRTAMQRYLGEVQRRC